MDLNKPVRHFEMITYKLDGSLHRRSIYKTRLTMRRGKEKQNLQYGATLRAQVTIVFQDGTTAVGSCLA